jgi:HK97 family phage portal protein
MGIFTNLLNRKQTVPEQRNVQALIPSRNISTVTMDSALSLGAVYRCINIIATSVSQCPVQVFRNGVNPISTPPFITQPTLGISQRSFLFKTATSLALDGNAYWYITRKADGSPINIEILPVGQVSIEVLHDNSLRYSYAGQVIDPYNLQHLKICDIAGRPTGLGAIQAAKLDIQNSIDIRNYATEFFSDGAVPSGILSTDQHLNGDQAEELKERFVATQQKNTPAVLSNGLEYQQLSLSPKDLQWLEARSFSIQDISRIFGVPASFLLASSGDSQTYANLETVNRAFVNFTLMSYFGVIEDAFTSLLPKGVSAKFSLDAFLRGDTLTRYNAYSTALNAGWMTINEVRELEGMGTLDVPLPVSPVENTNNADGTQRI